MAGKTQPDHSEELSQLAEWCRTILGVIKGVSPKPEVYSHFDDAIARSVGKSDLRGLRAMSKDFTQWAESLQPALQVELDKQLRARCGRGLREERGDSQKEIARILRRGQIDNEDEYRLLMAHADEIYADESRAEELERVNSLLATFEED